MKKRLWDKLLVPITICIVSFGLFGCSIFDDDKKTVTEPVTTERLAIIANADDDTATIIDGNSLEVVYDSIALTGDFPWEITLSEDGNTAYIMNRYSNNISIVDMSTGTETGTIALTGSEPAKAVIAADGFLYVCYDDSGLISKVDIDAILPVEDSTIVLSNSSSWTAIAATPAGDYLYVGAHSDGALSKVDIATGTEIDSWTGEDGIPSYIWDIEINSAGLAYFASYGEEEIITWDTTTDSLGDALPSGMYDEWMVDMVLDGPVLFATHNADDDNGAVVVVDTEAEFDNFAYDQYDDESYDVELPFTFTFLGTEYTTVSVNSNGAVSFDGYVSYETDLDGVLGFSPNNEDLDSGDGYMFNYSSMVFDDHAVFQWSTATSGNDSDPNVVTVFEVVLYADDTARFDYAFSMPEGVGEDGEYIYGIGDGSGTPAVDMRELYGSPYELENRSFLWNPAVSTTSVSEVDFEWEGTGLLYLPVTGLPHGVAVSDNYVLVPLTKDYGTDGATSTTLAVYDLETGLPVDPVTVGAGPRAIAIQQ